MKSSDARKSLASPYTHCAEWVPLDAMDAYFDLERDAASDPHRKCLRRLVSHEAMRAFYKRWSGKLGYLTWSAVIGASVEAVHLPYTVLHDAPERADSLLRRVTSRAEKLAAVIEEYSALCVDCRVESPDWRDSNGDPMNPNELIDSLRSIATRSQGHRHTRYGTGKTAWESRIQLNRDLLPQFVRYLDARIASYCSARDISPKGFRLSHRDIALLAIAALDIPLTADDALDKIKYRVQQLRG